MSNDEYGDESLYQDGTDVDIPTQFTPSADHLAHEGPRDVGIVFIGDSFVAGYGDPKGHGWVSRVIGRTQHPDLDLTSYNLGVRGDSSADVLSRWRTEGMLRWRDRRERRLVLGVGMHDVAQGLTTARSRRWTRPGWRGFGPNSSTPGSPSPCSAPQTSVGAETDPPAVGVDASHTPPVSEARLTVSAPRR